MTISYTVYDNTSGQIQYFGTVPDSTHYALIPVTVYQTLTTDSIDSDAHWYYVSGVLTARPLLTSVASWSTTSITANGVSSAVFGSGIPNPTTVSIIQQGNKAVTPVSGTITSGTLTITANYPGTYLVTMNVFPYQDYSQVITAT